MISRGNPHRPEGVVGPEDFHRISIEGGVPSGGIPDLPQYEEGIGRDREIGPDFPLAVEGDFRRTLRSRRKRTGIGKEKSLLGGNPGGIPHRSQVGLGGFHHPGAIHEPGTREGLHVLNQAFRSRTKDHEAIRTHANQGFGGAQIGEEEPGIEHVENVEVALGERASESRRTLLIRQIGIDLELGRVVAPQNGNAVIGQAIPLPHP